MKEKGKVVTICGSMKYADTMIAIAQTLTAGGNVVLFPFEIPNSPIDLDKTHIDNYKEELCWDIHKQRIEMSDTIYVVNIDGYIGNHTKKNIEFAQLLQKQIVYHEPVENNEEDLSEEKSKISDELQAEFNRRISEYIHRYENTHREMSNTDFTIWGKAKDILEQVRVDMFGPKSE